jgi:NAD-dependent DNA ligase
MGLRRLVNNFSFKGYAKKTRDIKQLFRHLTEQNSRYNIKYKSIDREKLDEVLKSNGARVTGSVSGKTHYLIYGESSSTASLYDWNEIQE